MKIKFSHRVLAMWTRFKVELRAAGKAAGMAIRN